MGLRLGHSITQSRRIICPIAKSESEYLNCPLLLPFSSLSCLLSQYWGRSRCLQAFEPSDWLTLRSLAWWLVESFRTFILISHLANLWHNILREWDIWRMRTWWDNDGLRLSCLFYTCWINKKPWRFFFHVAPPVVRPVKDIYDLWKY